MLCGNCGTQNQEGAEFCSECGNGLLAPAAMPQASVTPEGAVNAAAAAQSSLSITPISICAAGLLVSFFMPWIKVFFVSVSGADIAKAAGEFDIGSGQFLWLIPVMAIVTLVAGLIKKGQNGLAILSGLGSLGFIIYVMAKVIEEAGDESDEIFSVIGIGIYLMVAMGALLLILGLKGIARAQK